jgi:hypothetical protein
MRPFLRRASLVLGALLIVSAFRAATPVCHTPPRVTQTTGASTPTPTTPAGDRQPDFSVGFGTEVEEKMCVTDLRMPAAFAVAGVAAFAAAAMYRSNQR